MRPNLAFIFELKSGRDYLLLFIAFLALLFGHSIFFLFWIFCMVVTNRISVERTVTLDDDFDIKIF